MRDKEARQLLHCLLLVSTFLSLTWIPCVTQAKERSWILQGGLTWDSIRFRTRGDGAWEVMDRSRLESSQDEMVRRRVEVKRMSEFPPPYRTMEWSLQDLEPETQYEWRFTPREKSGGEDGITGSFRTPRREGLSYNFTFALASCADNDSNSKVFTEIRERDPLFFIHMGDLHYGNLDGVDSDGDFLAMFDRTLTQPNQAALYRNVPLVYQGDDHDRGPNNADKRSLSRNASLRAYRAAIPSYPLAAPARHDAAYHRFSIGRVTFLVTDTTADKEGASALGHEQLAWLLANLESSSKDPRTPLVVWVSTMPWIDAHSKWGEFPRERQTIGQAILDLNMSKRLVVVSGDAHMLAVDDGSHSSGGVVVFHAAALDSKPTTKGGPYSHGVWPGRGQFGWATIVDDGNLSRPPCFVFQGIRSPHVVLVEFDTCHPERAIPKLYTPSPHAAQRIWKRAKRRLEAFASGRAFLERIDGCTGLTLTMTFPRAVFISLAVGILLALLWIVKDFSIIVAVYLVLCIAVGFQSACSTW